MAIAFRAGTSIAVASGNSPLLLTKPTGLTEGDVMIAIVGGANDYTTTNSAGFTELFDTFNAEGNQVQMGVYYKVATASDVSATDFSFTTSSGADMAGCLLAFSGVDNTDPIGGSNGTTSATDSSNPSFTGFTPDGANCMYIMAWNHCESSRTASGYAMATSDPGWTEFLDMSGNLTDTGRPFAMSVAYSAVRPESTATGNFSVTFSANEQRYAGFMLALNPATSGATSSFQTNLPLMGV